MEVGASVLGSARGGAGLSGPVIILVRPQLAENIGMAARAMANFGLSRLRLVAPRDGWSENADMQKAAFQAAVGAAHILENAELFETIEGAVGDLVFTFATTARERGQAKPVFAPAEGMQTIFEQNLAPQSVGILFGPERTGLESDDVSLADAVLTFPINPAFSSLNLAQAVLLVSYEWMRASQGGLVPFALPSHTGPAKRATLVAFFSFVEAELERVRYFWPVHRKPVMVRNLRNIFHRMRLTEQDIRTLRGALGVLIDGGRGERASRSGESVGESAKSDDNR